MAKTIPTRGKDGKLTGSQSLGGALCVPTATPSRQIRHGEASVTPIEQNPPETVTARRIGSGAMTSAAFSHSENSYVPAPGSIASIRTSNGECVIVIDECVPNWEGHQDVDGFRGHGWLNPEETYSGFDDEIVRKFEFPEGMEHAGGATLDRDIVAEFENR